MSNDFVYESSDRTKIITFFVILLSISTIAGLFALYILYQEGSIIDRLLAVFFTLSNIREIDYFFLAFVGGLFFIPLPLEFLYYLGLKQGNIWFISLFFLFCGWIASQTFNYMVGSRISRYVLHILPKNRAYKIKRWVNKRGIYVILLLNLVPSMPAPLLTFVLGMAKYPPLRLFSLILVTNLAKYLIIIFLIAQISF